MSIFGGLPEKVCVGGEEFEINTDFRVWIEIEQLIFNKRLTDAERLSGMIVLAMPEVPDTDVHALVSALLEFCFGDMTESKDCKGTHKKALFDYDEDSEYIYSAFLAEFGIDLTTASLHWHKFKALLKSLSDDCKFSKIVGYRSTDTSKIKDKEQRRYYEKMKRIYSLPDRRTEDEKEADLAESLAVFF